MIRGFVKTKRWTVISWSEKSTVHEVSVQTQAGNFAQVGVKLSTAAMTTATPATKSGPVTDVDPRHLVSHATLTLLGMIPY